MTPQLAGKVALVTGSSKGIGAGIARHLAAAGAAVVVNYSSSREPAEQVVAAISGAGGQAIALPGSVAKQDEVERLFAEAARAFGPLDILVNNAGLFDLSPLGTITPEQFRRLFDTNVLGTILATQEALKHLKPSGGSIINISSNVSTNAPAGTGVYNATKSAIDALTRTFAKELGPRRIRVNSVNPGPTETDGVHAQGLIEHFRELGKQTALGRIGQPTDVAAVVAFLASDEASWITGETYYVTGGLK